MRQATHILSVPTAGEGLYAVTRAVSAWVRGQAVSDGLLTAFCRHTSASLLIQENADPDVQTDLRAFFARLAPHAPGRYVHGAEGPDDMPAHLRAALTSVQLSIPIIGGALALGRWQGIYLFEHRTAPHQRELALHLIGNEK